MGRVVTNLTPRAQAIALANVLTKQTEMQHHARYVKGFGWVVENVVSGRLFARDGSGPITVTK